MILIIGFIIVVALIVGLMILAMLLDYLKFRREEKTKRQINNMSKEPEYMMCKKSSIVDMEFNKVELNNGNYMYNAKCVFNRNLNK